ncbi:cytochrome c oxidase assembly protein subunit 15 [Algoriphagus ratkowskyi]|uniref:Cytochrome c oxidase assembly protein subunit 15 n=1 Tax=Algoriphagus ratkowskyi TaxID=57028 RepID=A0A2W7RK83_9BACT|nr:COX15/CtaA family protein [Algoriphagus ratkowskyi]PZX55997.1 cytochrome c oxidase assembly protein subunit 15 [Algoriphagus ratkowskyi]TXD77191.1 heme A synthase [Algoriphagus ratkowskyi]
MQQVTDKLINSFRRVSVITVIAVYILILIGGIVRSSGSGMGCPDWPKCFGSFIPPTSVDQLPANYQEIYLNKRIAKNERFVATIERLGFSEKAEEIANDKSILIEEEFNPMKTWIEYLNRLAGVIIGLLIILTVWKSFPLGKLDRWIPILSVFNLILVIFIGWIGSIVVSTNLLHWMITFHMLQALLLVSLLINVYHRSGKLVKSEGVKMDVPQRIELVLLIGTFLMLIQIVLGTQVREQIDIISSSLGNMLRNEWIDRIGFEFLIHRSFSIVLVAIHVLYFFWAFKYTLRKSQVNLWSQVLMILIILEIATGITMAYFGIPAFLQPIHLLLGTLIIGVQVILLLEIRENVQYRLNTN